ncbi:hypothetical protein GLV98_11030 [Halobacillus litoralis]|uniref:Uncharacterized protein n=1 Tax=Halobacillus litoralis TaxID=45668 RepID=A0A845EE86_9BACI|nr:hypothetical protein [Halobacillus litoralis]MYL50021.1 hypothetical protein [Halobacillus litoralis]
MLKYFVYAGIIFANIRAVRGSTENMILMFFASAAVIVLLEAGIRSRRNTYL